MPPGDGSVPPGKTMTVGQHIIDKGAQLMQSLKPIKQMSQHVCTFASYSHDMTRQIETHHYVSRLNQGLPPITSGLWVNPHFPEMIQKPELRDLARSYGKFWCTWQVDRGS
ncbi:hypothetical protein Fot_34235 [Forsythia ovata]|uniref:Uncharacterized protein n=1 Tax=Forsythia ovata TaxID=205694 RepID=A0ABD1SI33_9LAMI